MVALDLPAIAVLREVSAPAVRHKHRILPVIVMLSVLFPTVDRRRLVPFVLAEMELSVGLVPVLTPSDQSLGLGLLSGLHSFRNDV